MGRLRKLAEITAWAVGLWPPAQGVLTIITSCRVHVPSLRHRPQHVLITPRPRGDRLAGSLVDWLAD